MPQSIGELIGIPASKRTYNDSQVLALSKCLIGLELECENVKVELPSTESDAGFWNAEKDDSLRGNSKEFVLKEPLFGEDLLSAAKWLCTWALENNFETNYRTGLHVHVDVRNLSSAQLVSMLVYYSLFEPVLFKWIGNGREGSIFCMPFYKAEGGIESVIRAFKAPHRMKDFAAKIDRYSALNLNALSKYGSVEWRHMQTTFDYEILLKWINVAQSFKKYAKNHPLNPKELLAELSKLGPEQLFTLIMGEKLHSELWFPEAEALVFNTGLPVAQDMALLLEDARSVRWDVTRNILRPGNNMGLAKWAAKTTAKKDRGFDEVPDNIFNHPNIGTDPIIREQAIEEIRKMVREQLDQIQM